MNILFWVGYANPRWDKGTWENNGIGGSEYCVLKLADYLDTLGHDITISGDVNTGNWYGVKYVHYNDLSRNMGPIGLDNHHTSTQVHTHYDVVIAINYINYFPHLEKVGITFDKNYFWMHNEEFYKWYRGVEWDGWKDAINKIDGIVGVSEFHANILKDHFKALGYTPSQSNTYIHSIDNAIDLGDYKNRQTLDKIPGRIIWTSSPDRGLDFILDNWLDWKRVRPDLSLAILCPQYGEKWFNRDIASLPDVEWQGARCPIDLKNEIDKAEYWIYVSDYVETYCISALEMMMGKVKLITSGPGNLENLITNDRGVVVDINPDTVRQVLIDDKINWDNKITNAYNWAVQQNWNVRVNEWLNLVNYEQK